jgi:tetratricopeptide (TPR) repeat protein
MASHQQSNLYKILTERLREHLDSGDLERAEKIAKTAVESARRSAQSHDENLPLLLETLRELAALRLASADVNGAVIVYQEAFGLARGNRFVSPEQIAFLKSELAGALDRQGKGEEAVPLYQDAVEIFESTTVNELVLAAKIRNNLALIFKEKGSLELAEEHYLVSLNAYELACGPESLEVSSIYNNIGGLYQAAGHLKRAVEMHVRAWELRETLAGEGSLDAGQSLSNLAAAHHALGEYAKADGFYKRARMVLAGHRATAPEVCEIVESNHRVLLEEAGDTLVPDDQDDLESLPVPTVFHDSVRLTRQLALG